MFQSKPSHPRSKDLPTMYDLPTEEVGESGLPDEQSDWTWRMRFAVPRSQFHPLQAQLLRGTFQPPNYWPENALSAMDMNIYYDLEHPLWYKRPDWFGVVGVSRFYEGEELRWSYVMWQEEIPPCLVVELLSSGTEEEDLGQTVRKANSPPTKWEVYEGILQVPYYVIYDRGDRQFRGFHLERGRYIELELTENRLWMPELELGLGLWEGSYDGHERLWLRFYDSSRTWIPTPEERAEQERQRANREQQRADRAERERQSAQSELEALRDRLRAMNIDPDRLS